jgi:DNA-directed RNA polymerase specialized sigma subunit
MDGHTTVDTARMLRNQELLTQVRDGQRMREDLRLCEIGIGPTIRMAEICMAALSDPMVELLTIDMRTARMLSENAESLVRYAMSLLSSMKQCAVEDSSIRPMVGVMEHGFRVVRGNITKLRDYPDPNMGGEWHSEAVTVMHYIAAMRQRMNSVVIRAKRARQMLVDENVGLMRMVASDACRRDMNRYDDMFGIAGSQFVVCMDRTYDLHADSKVLFTTYATKCMALRCRGAMASPQSLVHIPNGRLATALKVMSGEVSPDADEIVDTKERADEASIRRKILALSHPISLDAVASEDGNATIADIRLAAIDPEFDRIIDETAVVAILNKALQTSSLAHHLVMDERLGIRGGDGDNTLEEIARMLHHRGMTQDEVSRQRVGQLLRDAKKMVRLHLESNPQIGTKGR